MLQTFIRLNLLVLLLCVVMDRAYQFYYFVPLVSFWFVVIYTTMAVYPKITAIVIESELYIIGETNIQLITCEFCIPWQLFM